MLRIENETPFLTQLVPALGPNGDDYAFLVVKGVFDLSGGSATPLAEATWTLADVYLGEPGSSSIHCPCDLTPPKAQTDVLMSATAYAPEPTTELSCSLRVGTLHKTVRVLGDRVYCRSVGGTAISAPAPFTQMPLTYERAFGGTHGNQIDQRNLVGVGVVVPDADDVEGRRLPNLEDPSDPIRRPGDCPPPAGFGVISPNWLPRASLAGTYDERWREERCPFLPVDFDDRFLQLAPHDLIAKGHLRGGEDVAISNVRPGGKGYAFRLPRYALQVEGTIDGRSEPAEAKLDTVRIDADAQLLELRWTATVHCGRHFLSIDRVTVRAEELS